VADLYYIDDDYFTPDGYFVYTADADAAVQSSLTLSATVGVIKLFNSDLSDAVSVTAVISHIHGADLQAFSNAALTTTPNIIRNLDSNITAIVSQSSIEERIRNADAAWTSSFSLTAESGSAEQGQADLSVISSLSVDAVANRSASITQDTIVTLSSQNDRIRYADASASIISTFTSDVVKTVEAISTLSTSSTQTTNIERIQQGTISVTALFTPTLDAVITVNSFAVLETSVTVTAQAQKQTDITSSISSQSSIATVTTATREYAASLTQAVNQTAVVVKTVEVSISISSAFAPSLSVSVFKNQVADLTTVISLTSTATVTRTIVLNTSSQFNQTASVVKTISAAASINSQFAISINGGFRELAQASLTAYSQLFVSRSLVRPHTFILKSGATSTNTRLVTPNETINGVANAGKVKYGNGALFLRNSGTSGIESASASADFFIPANTEFFIGAWIYGNKNIPGIPSTGGHKFLWAGRVDSTDTSIEDQAISWGLGFGETINQGYYPYRIRFILRTGSSTYQELKYDTDGGNGSGTFNQWNYWHVLRDSSNVIKLYWNNDLVDSLTYSGGSWPYLGSNFSYQTQKLRISNNYFFVGTNDEGLFVDNVVFKVGDSSLTGWTGPSTDTANTRVLLSFNDSFNDQEGLTQTGQAALATVATVSAAITYSTTGSATISSQVTVSAAAAKTVGTSVSASSQFTQSCSGTRVRFGQSSLTTETSVTVTATVTKTAVSAISSAFSQSTVNSRTRASAITTDSVATQLSAVAKIGDFLIAFDANITSVVSAVKTASGQSSISSQSTLSTDADLIANGATSISSSSSVAASFDRTRDHTVDIGATISQTTLPVKTTDSTIILSSQFNQLVETSGIIRAIANLQSIASINCVITRNRFADSTLAATTSVQTDAIVVLQASASFSAESNTSIDNSRTRAVGIQTDSIATQLTAVALTGQGFITLDAPVTLTTVAIKTAVSSSDLNSSSNVYCLFGIIKPAASSLTSTASLSADGVLGIVGESYNQTTSTLACVAVKTTEVSSTNSIITSVSALAVRTRRVGIQLFASGGQLIEGRRIKFAQANLVTTSTMTCLGGVNLVILNQTLFNTATVTAQVRSIHIDPYLTWTIDEESRSYKVKQETRLRDIAEESRIHIIEGA
jgi:hypothetical protein